MKFKEAERIEQLVVANNEAEKSQSMRLIASDKKAGKTLAAVLREIAESSDEVEVHDLETLYGEEAKLALTKWQASGSVLGSPEHVAYELARYCAEAAEQRLQELLQLKMAALPNVEDDVVEPTVEVSLCSISVKRSLSLECVAYLLFALLASTVHPLGAAWVPLLLAAWLASEEKSGWAIAAVVLGFVVGFFSFVYR